MSQNDIPLYSALLNHASKKTISFHVPGHKSGEVFASKGKDIFESILTIDQTEITGLDDLHAPSGVIANAETLLSKLYQTKASFFLVNGTTSGNLAMILSICQPGDTVIVQRNCHKSIINALIIAKAKPVFIAPEVNNEWNTAVGIHLETVKMAIQLYPFAKALILTYPNYYGQTYALNEIISLSHQHHIPVLIDEAHGPHFILEGPFPTSALSLGADVVVQSAHKTLPAMTMGSFLHINSKRIPVGKVRYYLQAVQSSSPSYPIMASLDLARHYLATFDKNDITGLMEWINLFKHELDSLEEITVLTDRNIDPLKITIRSTKGLSGFELQSLLEKEEIYTELADPFNVLLVIPLMKKQAYLSIEELVKKIQRSVKNKSGCNQLLPTIMKTPSVSSIELLNPIDETVESIDFQHAEGYISGEMIIPYPPGIPLFLPGEQITKEHINYLLTLLRVNAKFQGGSMLQEGKIQIIKK